MSLRGNTASGASLPSWKNAKTVLVPLTPAFKFCGLFVKLPWASSRSFWTGPEGQG